jgi:putative endonuclease
MIRRWWTALRAGLIRLRRPVRLGPRGEALAARHLKRLGYKIVARGARGQLGELDLVAVDGRTVVFVEVKTRESHDGGHPAEAVDADKQRRLTRLAVGFLKRHDLLECASRFDVVAVTWPAGRRRPLVEHIRDAFEASGSDGMFS